MWKEISFCIYTACLLNISFAAKLTEVIGYKGTNISFQISYLANFEKHDKYFGRSDGFFSKKLIQTSQANRWVRHGRFALFDNTAAHRFTVLITGLMMEDSGLYLCGADIKLQTDPVSEIQITVRKGETQRPTTPPRVVISSLHSPTNITTQNQAPNKNQESYLRFVAILSLVCVCAVLCGCLFAVLEVLKRVTTGKMSALLSYHTRKVSDQVVDEYVEMSSIVLQNSPTSHGVECFAVIELDRSTNTEAAPDIDPHYIDAATALTESLDLDQIYTEMDGYAFSDSVYQIIDQTSD
nr:CMRF35-like molecule 9 [Misgurnus anguillicaudatus]